MGQSFLLQSDQGVYANPLRGIYHRLFAPCFVTFA
jgi:hypothetical protein